jgi:hypothetical protein
VFSGKPFEKAARADLVSCKALELPHHPSPKHVIDVSEQGRQSRWCVSSVVFDPTPQEEISAHLHFTCFEPFAADASSLGLQVDPPAPPLHRRPTRSLVAAATADGKLERGDR